MLISASYTPFNSDYSVNLNLIEALYQNLIHQGVAGTLVCGTTGEGYALSNKERKLLVEAWTKAMDDQFKLYVHVGHSNIPDILELSAHAVAQQVEGLVISAPNYFRPAELEDLVLFLKEAVVRDAGIKVYYYHIPSLTGVDFPMSDFLKLAEIYQLQLTGIKYTHDNLDDFESCLHFRNGKYDIMFGMDELFLEALERGGVTALGSTYNYMAGIFHKIRVEHTKGNSERALTLQDAARDIIDILIKYGGGIIGGKAFMKLIGLDCGPVRLPLRSLSNEQLAKCKSELEKTSFYEYTNTTIVNPKP